jgi:adiponectin receptor
MGASATLKGKANAPPRTGSSGSSHRHGRPSAAVTSDDSGSSKVGSLIDAAKTAEAKLEQALLILWDDLPAWRRDNAWIRSGYRATSNSYLRSLRSLGYLHNESVNIWSHLLGAVAFTACGFWLGCVVAPRYPSASAADVTAFACFFAGAAVCLGMSATYHALANHSAEVAKWGNKLDYTGIVFLIVGSYVPALYYGFFCYPALLRVYLSAVCTSSTSTTSCSQSTRQC